MNRKHLLIVAKNEADRYLEPMLKYHRYMFDDMVLVDDNSTDQTKVIARNYCDYVLTARETSFMENEGAFRQEAWEKTIDRLKCKQNDTVTVLDADEFLPQIAAQVSVQEMWSYTEKRIDGFWDTITAQISVTYDKNISNEFKSGFGVGRFPADYLQSGPINGTILHYGYANQQDTQAKYNRYKNTAGHSTQHIESIVKPPILQEIEVPEDIQKALRCKTQQLA